MKITDKNISQYLQKYMDGQTSVEEERMLALYFRKRGNKDVPGGFDRDDWQIYREMFIMFEPKPQVCHYRIRHLIAASATLLLAFGAWMWLDNNQPATREAAKHPLAAITAIPDSTATATETDSLNMEATPVPQPAGQPAKRKGIDKNRFRDTPPPPRHYLAQASNTDSTTINLDEAARQADLLMQAVYIQQQSDLNNLMNQYTATMASIDDYCEDEENIYY